MLFSCRKWRGPCVAAWLFSHATFAQTPLVDTGFVERTNLPDVDVVIVREQFKGAGGVDLTGFGIGSGADEFVQSIYVRQFAPQGGGKKASAGRIVFPPEITILGIVTRGQDLGGGVDNGTLTETDAIFGIDVSLANDYSSPDRGFEAAGEEFVCQTSPQSVVFGLSTTTGVDDFRILIDYGDTFAPGLSFDVSTYGVPELFSTPLNKGYLVGNVTDTAILGSGDFGEAESVLEIPLTAIVGPTTQDCSLLAQPGRSVYFLRQQNQQKSLDAFDVDARTPVPSLFSINNGLGQPIALTQGPDDRLYAIGQTTSYATVDVNAGFLTTATIANLAGANVDLTALAGTRELWFVRDQASNAFVDRFDVDTRQFLQSFQVNGLSDDPAGITAGADQLVYVLAETGTLVGMDPFSGFELAPIAIPGPGTYVDLSGHPSKLELVLLRDQGASAAIEHVDLTTGLVTPFATVPISDAIGITHGPDDDLFVVGVGQGNQTAAYARVDGLTGQLEDFNTCMDFTGQVKDIAFTDPPPTGLFCTAKVNSQGCLPQITATGSPSFSLQSPFTISASDVINQKNGMLAFGFTATSLPFANGILCVQPFFRTLPQRTGGTLAAADCSGTLSIDFNLELQSNPALSACTSVFCQWFYRDTADPTGIGLTDALQFDPQP